MAERPFKNVLIVGAGPAGLMAALQLSKHGIPVSIVEMSHQLDQQPRAAHYGAAAIPEFKRAGIIDDIRSKGLNMTTLYWRRFEDHSLIAGFDHTVLDDVDGEDYRTVSYPLQLLDQLMLDLFLSKYNGQILWRHKVVGVGQDDKTAWVDVETPDGNKRIEASYIVGCDGANSSVRKSLFGNEFPGFTWDAQIIATNVSKCLLTLRQNFGVLMVVRQTYYDFSKFGMSDINFFIHPEHFFVSFPEATSSSIKPAAPSFCVPSHG